MLEKALQFTTKILRQHLRNKFALNDNVVVLNNVINPDGEIPLLNKNKIIISLLNIEQENNKQFYGRNQKLPNGDYANVNPFQRYNLDVLFSANFEEYQESLKFLNATLQFFQENTSVNQGIYADIPDGLNKIDYDLEQITYHQMHSLWSAIGSKYQPSIIYKIRLITIENENVLAVEPAVNSIENKLEE